MTNQDTPISSIRTDYHNSSLSEDKILKNPFDQFSDWLKEAIKLNLPDPTAMTLATTDLTGNVSARIVLLKGITKDGLLFFTNYDSNKGLQLSNNKSVAIIMFWPHMQRQIRVEGFAEKLSADQSDEYFDLRPYYNKLSAIASPQSQVIENRQYLEDKVKDLAENTSEDDLTRPSYWGGYQIKPTKFEFWQGRPNRLHDRLQFIKNDSEWTMQRLAP